MIDRTKKNFIPQKVRLKITWENYFTSIILVSILILVIVFLAYLDFKGIHIL
jgi:hypothetical protein